jgi:hypothetical protein
MRIGISELLIIMCLGGILFATSTAIFARRFREKQDRLSGRDNFKLDDD